MGADRQELEHRRLIEREVAGRDDVALGNAHEFAQASVLMDAEHAQELAAVGEAARAGAASPAIEVRLDGDTVACCESALLRRLDDLAGKLVADDTGISEIRLVAVIDVVVGAAHADAPDANQDIAFAADGLGAVD